MKHFTVLLFILLVCIFDSDAQDIIIKKSGDELRVKIEEINRTEIIFRYTDSLDSRLFFVTKAEVFMIKYANGKKELIHASSERSSATIKGRIEMTGSRYYVNGTALNESSIDEILIESKNEQAIDEMNQARSSKDLGKGLLIAGIPIASVGVGSLFIGGFIWLIEQGYGSTDHNTSNPFFYAGFAGVAIGTTGIIAGVNIMHEHKRHMHKAIVLYNSGL